jgi:hypothetical protein
LLLVRLVVLLVHAYGRVLLRFCPVKQMRYEPDSLYKDR